MSGGYYIKDVTLTSHCKIRVILITTTDHNGPQRTQNWDEGDQHKSQEDDKLQNNTNGLFTVGVGAGVMTSSRSGFLFFYFFESLFFDDSRKYEIFFYIVCQSVILASFSKYAHNH